MAAATTARRGKAPSFEYTATGVLGDKRNTMLQNELHLRSELGKSKGHGYSISVGPSHTYGHANPVGGTGVKEALIWITPDGKMVTDYKRTGGKNLSKSGYGQPPRPSTPINNILTFKYQNDWIERERLKQKAKTEEARSKRQAPGAYRENHTSSLRFAMSNPSNEELCSTWQMNKFSNHAHRHIDTFRSESERERAFKSLE